MGHCVKRVQQGGCACEQPQRTTVGDGRGVGPIRELRTGTGHGYDLNATHLRHQLPEKLEHGRVVLGRNRSKDLSDLLLAEAVGSSSSSSSSHN